MERIKADRRVGLRALLAAAVIFAAVFLAYGNVIRNGFHYDDEHTILRNPAVRSFGLAARSIVNPEYFSLYRTAMTRPLTVMSYWLNYAVGGFDASGWMALNLLIHLLTSFLAALVVRELILKFNAAGEGRGLSGGPSSSWDDSPASVGGVVGGLLFALHPLQSEAVNYLSARSSLLAAFFYLAALLAWLRLKNLPGMACSIALFALALLSRETAVTFVAVIAMVEGLDYLKRRGGNGSGGYSWAEGLLRLAPFTGVLGLYFMYRRAVLGVVAGENFVRPIADNVVLQLISIVKYQGLLAYPAGLSISRPIAEGAPPHGALLFSGAVVMAEIIVAAILVRRKPIVSLAAGWFYIALSPTIVIPLNVVVSEHRVYLAMVGPALLFGWLAGRWAGGSRLAMPLVCALMVVLALASRSRNEDWRSDVSLWRSAAQAYPMDDKSWIQYGIALKNSGDFKGAARAYRSAISVKATSEAYNNLSVACGGMGDYECARESIEKAVALNPENPNALYNWAEKLIRDGDFRGAERAYRKAIEIRPVFPEAYRNLAVLLMKDKTADLKEIMSLLVASLRQDPYQRDAAQMKKVIQNLAEQIKYRIPR